jgi:hypothetical protein
MWFARPQQLIGIRECGAWVFVRGCTLRKDMPRDRRRARRRCKEQSRAVYQATRQMTSFVRLCFVWVSEQATIISSCSHNVTETKCVYCAVRAEPLNVFQFVLSRLSDACPLYICRCSVRDWERSQHICLHVTLHESYKRFSWNLVLTSSSKLRFYS